MFYFAKICVKGHVQSAHEMTLGVNESCATCQSRVISTCLSCDAPIRGQAVLNVAFNNNQETYTRPDTCEACGTRYPWVKE